MESNGSLKNVTAAVKTLKPRAWANFGARAAQIFHQLPAGEGRWEKFVTLSLLAITPLLCLATYLALSAAPPFGKNPEIVVWLLNIDLIAMLGLCVMIARRVVTLFIGRRKGLAGSRLHIRLVYTFALVAALPAIMMAIFSAFFLHFGVQSWFSERVQSAITNSLAVSRAYLDEHKGVIRADILAMSNDLARQSDALYASPENFAHMMDTQALLRNFSEAVVFNGEGRILARGGLGLGFEPRDLPRAILSNADLGDVGILAGDDVADDTKVNALVRLSGFSDAYLFVSRDVDAKVLSHLKATEEATTDYATLQTKSTGLQITVTMIFIVVALLLMMGSVWFGISVASGLVQPIGHLVAASERVRAGDLTARVDESATFDEFQDLGRSFNRMTRQIEDQRNELMMANRQLDQRRRFTETVLTGVSSGVLGLEENGQITIANVAAARLLGMEGESIAGQNIFTFLPELKSIADPSALKGGKMTDHEVEYDHPAGTRHTFLIRFAADLIGDDLRRMVMTFDDITTLKSAQRQAAWADVARRIAHEIKNPLTPIQLSAERLRRRFMKQVPEADQGVFSQCTDTIIRHVGDIGRMVTEFTNFGRMPEPVFQDENLSHIIKDVIEFQAQAHSEIEFITSGLLNNKQDALVSCDAQLIRQAITNLILNAIDALVENGAVPYAIQAALYQTDHAHFAFCLSDSGPGFPKTLGADRLTEPYVTTRDKGTGLGLAIVKKIMEDHNGQLILGQQDWLKQQEGWQDLGGALVTLIFSKHALDKKQVA